MNHLQKIPAWVNKVPEVTLVFWLIKMMSTTVGETAADFLNADLGFGLVNTSFVIGGLLAVSLYFQMRATRYIPALYWLTVVFISVFGTLITDNLTDALHVPLAYSSLFFSVALLATFALWYVREKTLSIHHIDSAGREAFYWLAILFTFALGTAVGDWLAEGLSMRQRSGVLWCVDTDYRPGAFYLSCKPGVLFLGGLHSYPSLRRGLGGLALSAGGKQRVWLRCERGESGVWRHHCCARCLSVDSRMAQYVSPSSP